MGFPVSGRSLVAVGAITLAGLVPFLPACSAPDPGEITFIARPGATNPSDENGDTTSSGSVATDAGGGTTSSSSGATEAGAVADTIFGTDAFKFYDPGESADTQPAPHTAKMEGMACLAAGCHGDPGAAGPKWGVGGTIFADVNGTKLAAGTQIEMRIIGPDKSIVSGTSFSPDADGNFWLDLSSAGITAIPDGSSVGIRTATGEMKMNTLLSAANSGANCSNSNAGCHGSTTFRIHIP